MRHLLFAASIGAALCLSTQVTNAQSVPVPGRGLLDFPLGTLGEVPALATATGGGLTNPATLVIGSAGPLSASIASLNAAGQRGVDGQFASVAGQQGAVTLGASVARLGVGGLDHTGDSDPQVLGTVPYSTYLISAVAARRLGGPLRNRLALGMALRYRSAHLDTTSASTALADLGAAADGLFGRRDVRLGVSTYLWRPGAESVERPGIHAGGDLRVVGPDATHEARLGLAYDATRGATREQGVYVAGRWTSIEARAAMVRASDFDDRQTRARFALGFRSRRLLVGVGHEATAGGFGSIWQFTLRTQIR